MKKLFDLKIILLILVIALSLSLIVACSNADENNDDLEKVNSNEEEATFTIPDFSINFVDYGKEIEVTDETLSDLSLHDCSRTSHDITTYYKGYKISEVLAEVTDIPEQTSIESLLFVASDGYGADQSQLLLANFANAYLCLLSCETEDGDFVALDNESGPVRVIDLSETSPIKSVKMLADIYITRPLYFEIDILDGDTTYKFNQTDAANLTLINYTYTKVKDDITYTTYYKGYNLSTVLQSKGIDMTGTSGITAAGYDFNNTIEGENIGNGILAVYTFITIDETEINSILDSSDGPVKTFCSAENIAFKNVKNTVSITVNRG